MPSRGGSVRASNTELNVPGPKIGNAPVGSTWSVGGTRQSDARDATHPLCMGRMTSSRGGTQRRSRVICGISRNTSRTSAAFSSSFVMSAEMRRIICPTVARNQRRRLPTLPIPPSANGCCPEWIASRTVPERARSYAPVELPKVSAQLTTSTERGLLGMSNSR